MSFTLEEVNGCHPCLDLANSATASKIQELQGMSHDAMLRDVLAIHCQQDHATRNALLEAMEAKAR